MVSTDGQAFPNVGALRQEQRPLGAGVVGGFEKIDVESEHSGQRTDQAGHKALCLSRQDVLIHIVLEKHLTC